jgi:hypothetical protein
MMAVLVYKPISPDEIMARHGSEKERLIQELVTYINGILTLDVSVFALSEHKAVPIYDADGSMAWNMLHEEAVDRFRKAGWVVQRDTFYEGEARYNFYLPKAESCMIPGTKVMRILPGFTAYERSSLFPEDRFRVRYADNELVRVLPREDGSFEVEVTDYQPGRGYYKERVVTVIDSYGICYSVPSRFLEDVPLV